MNLSLPRPQTVANIKQDCKPHSLLAPRPGLLVDTMASVHGLDAHTRPPEPLRILFKRLQKSSMKDIELDQNVLSLPAGVGTKCEGLRLAKYLEAHDLQHCFSDFLSHSKEAGVPFLSPIADAVLYEIEALPGQLEISWAASHSSLMSHRSFHCSCSAPFCYPD